MFDVDAMLKMLPMENLAELFGESTQTTYKGYTLTYLGRNNVSISTGDKGKSKRTMLWDLAQFYDYHSLRDMAKRYASVDSQKMESAVIAHFVSDQNNVPYYTENSTEIMKYCVQDCKATKELADLMEKRMEDEGYDFTTPYSVGNSAMKFFRNYLTNPDYRRGAIPRIHPTHWYNENAELRALEQVWGSIARGGWNDCFRRGKFDEVWDYDIVSAYPSVARDLPYWSGRWIETKDVDKIDKADYGLIDVTLSNLKLPLVPEIYKYFDNSIVEKKVIKWVNHSIIHCTIDERPFKTTLTTDQYQYLKELCDVNVNGGWILIPSHDTFPMREAVNDLIKKKTDAKKNHGKESVEYMLAKKMMNSATGKFKQKFHTKYTWFYYPHVYAKITWETKKIIADLISKNDAWKDLISVSTDGAVFTSKLSNVDLSGELGSFELIKLYNFVQIGNGIYYGNYEDGNLLQRMRGFHIFKYNLPELIEKHPDNRVIPIVTRRPLHLRECYKHHKALSISDTNRFIDVIKHVNINKEIKRRWTGRYENVRDLLSGRKLLSVAWEIREAVELSKAADKEALEWEQTKLHEYEKDKASG